MTTAWHSPEATNKSNPDGMAIAPAPSMNALAHSLALARTRNRTCTATALSPTQTNQTPFPWPANATDDSPWATTAWMDTSQMQIPQQRYLPRYPTGCRYLTANATYPRPADPIPLGSSSFCGIPRCLPPTTKLLPASCSNSSSWSAPTAKSHCPLLSSGSTRESSSIAITHPLANGLAVKPVRRVSHQTKPGRDNTTTRNSKQS
ncbi:hypothetical protein CKAH01_04680 [Colletotrichum kahawae]|uniref:Uncharacterized protein n=1 Tax=Colletotrichum kahawae TaxID=34407 RepID=A0AAD9YGD6_COLKA|nr:hypothetical protein CKAH01_04680 [Colletotrichum kahawae]